MTKNIIKIIVGISIILIIALTQCQSFAATNSLTITLTPDKTEIKAGETVTVLVKVTNIQGEGIVAFNANVNYDSDVFECTANGDDNGTWIKQGFMGSNLTTTRADLEASTENQTVAKLTYKAKSNATIGEQTISLSKIDFTTENDSYNVQDISTKVKIVGESTPEADEPGDDNSGNENPGEDNDPVETPDNTTGGTGTEQQGQGSTTTGASDKNTTTKNTTITSDNTTTKTSSLPKTGKSAITLVIISILSIVSVFAYKKYKMYKGL